MGPGQQDHKPFSWVFKAVSRTTSSLLQNTDVRPGVSELNLGPFLNCPTVVGLRLMVSSYSTYN